MSMMSAPSAAMRRACANALSGARKRPPSEKESGVIFNTPMTSGYGPDSRSGQVRWSAEAATGAFPGEVAIMRSLCAVGVRVSREQVSRKYASMEQPSACGRTKAGWVKEANYKVILVGDFGLELARLGD